MTRTAFLAALEQLLAPLPEAERKDALSYYEDYLDAAGPENEARAIAELGSPEEVARKILDEQTRQAALPPRHPPPTSRIPAGAWCWAAGWQCWSLLAFSSSIPRPPRCSRWNPLLLPRNFLLPLRKYLPRVPPRSLQLLFPLQTA